MLYWLAGFSDTISALNVFRYITFRTGGAVVTALLFVFLCGPMMIAFLPPISTITRLTSNSARSSIPASRAGVEAEPLPTAVSTIRLPPPRGRLAPGRTSILTLSIQQRP